MPVGPNLCVNERQSTGARRMETKDRFMRITVIIALVLVAGLGIVVHAYT